MRDYSGVDDVAYLINILCISAFYILYVLFPEGYCLKFFTLLLRFMPLL